MNACVCFMLTCMHTRRVCVCACARAVFFFGENCYNLRRVDVVIFLQALSQLACWAAVIFKHTSLTAQ
jgi:hypothetical protein